MAWLAACGAQTRISTHDARRRAPGAELRHRLYDILEHGSIGNRTGTIVGRLIALLIVINLVAMTLESVPALEARYGRLFTAIEILSLVVFTLEYGLRVWVARDHDPHRHHNARRAQWQFITSPLGVIDLLAVLPFWLALVRAARSADGPGLSHRSFSQACALLARACARCSTRSMPSAARCSDAS